MLPMYFTIVFSYYNLQNVATEDLVYSVVSLVFGNGSYPTDEKHLLEVILLLLAISIALGPQTFD